MPEMKFLGQDFQKFTNRTDTHTDRCSWSHYQPHLWLVQSTYCARVGIDRMVFIIPWEHHLELRLQRKFIGYELWIYTARRMKLW